MNTPEPVNKPVNSQLLHPRLLVVDDEKAICDLIKDVGERCGYEVTTVSEFSDFKEKLQNVDPTLIVLDLSIGENDGIEFLRFLSEKCIKCPIAVMSGHDEKVRLTASRIGLGYGLNMLEHLKKPLDLSSLMNIFETTKEKVTFITPTRLQKAIAGSEMTVHYQPIISLKTNQIYGAEALVRWQPPKQSLFFPDAFIPLAEESELIKPLSKFVFEEVFKQSAVWAAKGVLMNLQINISPMLLNDKFLPDEISALVKQYGVKTGQICFEITETGVMRQPVIAMDILTRLRIKGFSLSLDDFGTGYSSLVALHRMPFRELKIDKSFVMNILEDQESLNITNAIIKLAHSLNLEVVAEGVETKEVLNKLKELECDHVQGYYFAKPTDSHQFNEWLQRHTDKHLKLIDN